MCTVSPHQQLKSLVALSIKSNIDFVLTNLYDPTVEHSSFGRLNRLDCAIAIINLFVDQRWEEECYHFPEEYLNILREQIEIVEEAFVNGAIAKDKVGKIKLTLWNGLYILNTSTSQKDDVAFWKYSGDKETNSMTRDECNTMFCRIRDYHLRNNTKFGFELRKNNEWQYGDIEYDHTNNTLSCMGVSITVDLSTSFRENLEDLFEALLSDGYNTEF